ncbi:MAG TPA: UvrD-helicase domain-containing protein, partial [Burkholderiaceae bacterium]|nr:UvrD-helicase domain-containing protein [Burkholderiaceae bacterium]
MTAAQPSDAAQRQAAIDPSDSFIVQAPAGSGKTELLTDRLLALLALVNRPEEIVAITFTRKAAAEMQARVLAKLQSAQGPEPSQPHLRQSWHLARQALARDAELGWNLLKYPARLSIRTIDAFCAALVRTMPWSSTLGGVPAITDDARALYEEAAIETLSLIDEMPAVANFVEHLDV